MSVAPPELDADPNLDTVTEVAAKAVSQMATFAALMGKPARTTTFPVTIADEDGHQSTVQIKFKAIDSRAYDDLVAAHPPSAKEREKGAVFDMDTFAPALIAACSLEPKLSVEQATQLYNNPQWSGGEIATLFINAQRVCNAGLDVPFNDRD